MAGADANPMQRTLDTLPDDVLVQLLQAVTGSHSERQHALKHASRTCRRLQEAARRAAREHSLSLLPVSSPWIGEPPTCWHRCYADACSLSSVEWRPAPDVYRPPAIFAHSSTLWRQHLYCFGGRHGEQYSNALSMLELSSSAGGLGGGWTHLLTEGEQPSPRRAHAAAEHAGRLYVLGGGVADMVTCGDMHSVSLISPHTWRAEPAPCGWARFGHTCLCTRVHTRAGRRDALLVFGGASHKPYSSLEGDSLTRVFDLAARSWHMLEASGAPPRPRYRHSATMIHTGRTSANPDGEAAMVVWGGYLRQCDEDGATLATDEVFLLRLRTRCWEAPRTRGVPPAPRGGQTITVVGDKILIFGGGQLMDLRGGHGWQERDLPGISWLDMTNWEYGSSAPAGAEPGPRGGHTAQLIGYGGALAILMLGGRYFVEDATTADGVHSTGTHLGRAEAFLLVLRGREQEQASGRSSEGGSDGGEGRSDLAVGECAAQAMIEQCAIAS